MLKLTIKTPGRRQMFHFYTHWKRQKTKDVFFVNFEPTGPIHDFSERNQLLQDVTGTLITVASNPVNFIRVNAENIFWCFIHLLERLVRIYSSNTCMCDLFLSNEFAVRMTSLQWKQAFHINLPDNMT